MRLITKFISRYRTRKAIKKIKKGEMKFYWIS